MASLNRPSLLVLGGTGFIGRHIINKAVYKRWKVTCASLSLPNKKIEIIKLNIIRLILKSFLPLKKNLINLLIILLI